KYSTHQGSNLWPLLFLAYINDITEIPGPAQLIIYADDTNVFFNIRVTKKIKKKLAFYYL
ncbi:MAG: hypothetical protein O7D30_12875, partial [Rickettsia endosymbiont of Ixodes persulcatus]|nr:hypothetical protein [Rickettsia endosymbiont of Ixodes persulcatus]